MAKATAWAVLASGGILSPATLAQEGYPLDGTWRGSFGPEAANRTAVVIVMKWDGERINGMINPGPRSIDFTHAELDPGTWTVRIEAQPAQADGIVIEGTLRDVGSYNRFIDSVWRQGGTESNFRLTRE